MTENQFVCNNIDPLFCWWPVVFQVHFTFIQPTCLTCHFLILSEVKSLAVFYKIVMCHVFWLSLSIYQVKMVSLAFRELRAPGDFRGQMDSKDSLEYQAYPWKETKGLEVNLSPVYSYLSVHLSIFKPYLKCAHFNFSIFFNSAF